MRFIVKVRIPVADGNKMAREAFHSLAEIVETIKPEAAYFYEDQGQRTGLLIIDLPDVSAIPSVAEPFFLAFNASVEFHPAMVAADLQKAAPAVAKIVERFG